jgi:CheY-like chemotaxis protein
MTQSKLSKKRLTIATVEDSLDYSEILSDSIQKTVPDSNVVSFNSGDEFLAAVEQGICTPDVVFLDLSLPSMSGHDVLVKFRQGRARCAPVFVVTSSSLPEDIAQAYLESCALYFLKPAEPDDLIEVLQDLFRVLQSKYTILIQEGKW